MAWNKIVLLAVAVACIAAVSFHHRRTLKAEQRERELAIADLPDEVRTRATALLDKELRENIRLMPQGVMVNAGLEADSITFFSPEVFSRSKVECSPGFGIEIQPEGSVLPLHFAGYLQDLPFFPLSIAGKKLNTLLCQHAATYVATLADNAKPVDLSRLATTANPLAVSITASGDIYVQKQAVLRRDLQTYLSRVAGGDVTQRIYVRGDRAVPYGRVMQVVGELNAAGFRNVSLVTETATAPATPQGAGHEH